jgi:ATP-binding cassette subfamily F protein uup
VVEGFTTRVMRGDRVGFIGPNGAGKTTLLRMLCGDLVPDTGRLRLGPGVVPLYFDQKRETLDAEMTLWETLVEGGGDQVMVRGRPRHVVSYLRDYLFEERQALSPVKSLSGGERNRLLLARLLARPGNLLVLDEPTNDLDMETLDLLEEVLGDYDGTLLVVSHDRDFLDRIVTSIIAVEGGGDIVEYAGGYSDYLVQRGAPKAKKQETRPRRPAGKPAGRPRKAPEARMSYKDRHALERLPGLIDALAGEIGAIEARLADAALFTADRAAYDTSAERLEKARAELATAEERWLELESLREEIEARRRD